MAAHRKRRGGCILVFIFMMLKLSLRMANRTNCCSDFWFWSCRISFTCHEISESLIVFYVQSVARAIPLWWSGCHFLGIYSLPMGSVVFTVSCPVPRKVFLCVMANLFRLIFQNCYDSRCLNDLNFLNLFFISWKLCEISVLQMKSSFHLGITDGWKRNTYSWVTKMHFMVTN